MENEYLAKAMMRWYDSSGELLRAMYPGGMIIPLFRSALVILQDEWQEKRGAVSMVVHHDPRRAGDEVTEKTLYHHSYKLDVMGQPAGPEYRLWPTNCDCGPKESFEVITYAIAATRLREILKHAAAGELNPDPEPDRDTDPV